MYFQEIEPGVFLSNVRTLHHKLYRCRYCGATDTLSHQKYTDKCITCGNQYNLYHVRRSARRKNKITNKTAKAHLAMLNELLERRDCGFEAFPNLDEEFAETAKIVDNILALERLEAARASYATLPCACCGIDVRVRLGFSGTVKCNLCADTYARYTELRKRINDLSMDECDELAKILADYAEQQRRGYRIPHIDSIVTRLQHIRIENGLPKYRIYGGKRNESL